MKNFIKLDNQKTINELGVEKFLKRKVRLYDFVKPQGLTKDDFKKKKKEYFKKTGLLGYKELIGAIEAGDKKEIKKIKNRFFKDNLKIKKAINRIIKYL